ncbi:MAG: zinc-binding dehydrogenase [Verrucomicrobia bacterium]|nr:zinc-binding dehydrogenase [Verrucomicrobiota bacterium]
MTARQLIVIEPLKVAYEDLEVGPPSPGQVLLRIVLSGISHGTEMTAFLGTSPFLSRKFTKDRVFTARESSDPPFYPYRYMGYDAVGVVDRVGESVTAYRTGDRVWCPCHHQTEYIFEAANSEIFRLSEHVSNEEAILLNLAAVALTATNDAEIKMGGVVAVVGGGAVGQLTVQTAFAGGASKVFLIEPSGERRQFAAARSAVVPIDPGSGLPALQIQRENQGNPPDVVIECSGAVAGLHTAIQAAGIAGMVVAAGFLTGPATALCLGEEFLHNRVTIKASMGVWGCPSRHGPLWPRARVLREALALMESKRLKLDGFVSAKFPFADGQRAYDAIRAEPGKYLKVALTY